MKTRTSLMLIAAVTSVTAGHLSAQAANQGRRNFETRAELEAMARQAETGKNSTEASLIRARLQQGDFQAGDRILTTVEGAGGFSDTLTVEPGPVLPLPQLGELPLAGVLRSELVPQLRAQVAKYLRTATVRATPLVRLAVLGNVSRPGFYYTFADTPVSDALMAAGGPTQDADVAKIEVRRAGATILAPSAMTSAMTTGKSIDMLHLRAGDEIQVGKKRSFNTGTAVSIGGLLVGVAATAITLSRH
jgi:protein involved in polysaccharide export with SLBB domain